MRRNALCGLVLCAAVAATCTPLTAAALTVTLPTVSGSPGTLVVVPITVSDSPANYGIFSLDFRLTLNATYVFSSASQADGFLQNWGPPTVNGTGASLAAAAAGTTAISSTGTLLNTALVRLKPTAPVGTVIPLTFQHITFNAGTPAASVVAGSITVVAPAAGVVDGAEGFTLAVLANPARTEARLAFSVPRDAAGARLAVYDTHGRRVAELDAAAGPGVHAVAWPLRDGAGARVAPGLYFARLTADGRQLVRRIVVAG